MINKCCTIDCKVTYDEKNILKNIRSTRIEVKPHSSEQLAPTTILFMVTYLKSDNGIITRFLLRLSVTEILLINYGT